MHSMIPQHNIRSRLFCLILAALMPCGCSTSLSQDAITAQQVVVADASLATPEAVALFKDYVLVANTNYHFPDGKIAWKTGYVSVFSASTKRHIGDVNVNAKNPIEFLIAADAAYVLAAGETVIDANGVARPISDGSISKLVISENSVALTDTIALAHDGTNAGSHTGPH